MHSKPPRIAIPMPHSSDREYAGRSIPQYEHAVRLAGGEPVRVELGWTLEDAQKVVDGCDGVLLPGSNADVDPSKFEEIRSAYTAPADPLRDQIDELLLRDAYRMRKPILGICYGLQSLNVYCKGSLIQHIPDFLSKELRGCVDHGAGKKIPVAHEVKLAPDSKLASILLPDAGISILPVNSSHHQAAHKVGDGLRIVGRCAEDGIVEALEGTVPDHFVVAVQWHPERSVESDQPSRAIFDAFVKSAAARRSEGLS